MGIGQIQGSFHRDIGLFSYRCMALFMIYMTLVIEILGSFVEILGFALEIYGTPYIWQNIVSFIGLFCKRDLRFPTILNENGGKGSA